MEGQTTIGGRKSRNKFVDVGRSSFSGTQVVQPGCHKGKVGGAARRSGPGCVLSAQLRSVSFTFCSKSACLKPSWMRKLSDFEQCINVYFSLR